MSDFLGVNLVGRVLAAGGRDEVLHRLKSYQSSRHHCLNGTRRKDLVRMASVHTVWLKGSIWHGRSLYLPDNGRGCRLRDDVQSRQCDEKKKGD